MSEEMNTREAIDLLLKTTKESRDSLAKHTELFNRDFDITSRLFNELQKIIEGLEEKNQKAVDGLEEIAKEVIPYSEFTNFRKDKTKGAKIATQLLKQIKESEAGDGVNTRTEQRDIDTGKPLT